MLVKTHLRTLDLGKSVAEFDSDLEKYFVQTKPFQDLLSGKGDIIAGDKGTGKTAIFTYLNRSRSQLPELKDIEVLAAFNPAGSPVFKSLTEQPVLSDAEYINLWKAYVLSFVGNWLLKEWEGSYTDAMFDLDRLLRGLDLRESVQSPQNVFSRIINRIGGLFEWKSAEVAVTTDVSGNVTWKPKIEFDRKQPGGQENVGKINVESALRLLNQCISDLELVAWVALDRLDEAFQGFPQIEVPALRALFRTYLDLLEFDRIRLKLFVRRDLFRRITEGGFVNLTHINANKIEIIWEEEDLLNLLCKRIRGNSSFCEALQISDKSDSEIFNRIFPSKVDYGLRKPKTFTWIMRRIRDGNNVKPPRNLIDFVSKAQNAQLRREEREGRELKADEPVLESDALRRALTELSSQRVQDTLLAEAGTLATLIDAFREQKAEHDSRSLSDLFNVPVESVKATIKPLVELGFLEDLNGTYKVPTLYREGLAITQGRASSRDAPGGNSGVNDDD